MAAVAAAAAAAATDTWAGRAVAAAAVARARATRKCVLTVLFLLFVFCLSSVYRTVIDHVFFSESCLVGGFLFDCSRCILVN